MRERCPELGPVLDRLEREHAAGELMVRDLAHTLLAYEVLGEPRREACEQAVQRYVAFYLDHMGVEEEQILPAARSTWAPTTGPSSTPPSPPTATRSPATSPTTSTGRCSARS